MLNDRFWDPNKPKPPKKHKVIQEYGIEGLTEKEEAAAGAIYDYAEPTTVSLWGSGTFCCTLSFVKTGLSLAF